MWLRLATIIVLLLIIVLAVAIQRSGGVKPFLQRLGYVELIYNGEEVPEGEMPWVVYLEIEDRTARKFCGGTLVDWNWVITAAHCIPDPGSPESVTAYIYHRSSPPIPIDRILVHEGFKGFDDNGDPVSFENDLALLRLDLWSEPEPRREALSRFAIKLLDPSEFNGLAGPGATAIIVGWGETEDGEISDRLLYATLKIMSNDDCNRPRVYDGRVSGGMICGAPSKRGESICRGDSGGPMTVGDPATNEQKLAGVISWRDSNCAKRDRPSVFTRIETTDHWVERTIAANSDR